MSSEGKTDSYTLTAFFDDEYDAEAAAEALMDAGIPKDAVTMTPVTALTRTLSTISAFSTH
jgi:hypothetical protein